MSVQGRTPIRWNAVGHEIEWRKELCAEFGTAGDEMPVHNWLTGATDMGADIRGGLFDSAEFAQTKGWTQEEHDAVVFALDQVCVTHPGQCQLYSKPAAPYPWPSYADTHHSRVANLAAELGLAGEALAYELENKKRESVIAGLHEKLAVIPAPEPVEELTAA